MSSLGGPPQVRILLSPRPFLDNVGVQNLGVVLGIPFAAGPQSPDLVWYAECDSGFCYICFLLVVGYSADLHGFRFPPLNAWFGSRELELWEDQQQEKQHELTNQKRSHVGHSIRPKNRGRKRRRKNTRKKKGRGPGLSRARRHWAAATVGSGPCHIARSDSCHLSQPVKG